MILFKNDYFYETLHVLYAFSIYIETRIDIKNLREVYGLLP